MEVTIQYFNTTNQGPIDSTRDGISTNQWDFQDPKLEVPTIYKAYCLGLCKGTSP